MKPVKPMGFTALMERMPRFFRKQAKAVEKRACQRREAQVKRFELDFIRAEMAREGDSSGWEDTVAGFNGR